MKLIAGIFLAILLCAFKMDDAEKKVFYGPEIRATIEAFGFTEVKIEGPAFYGCGKDYSIVTEFTAIGPLGHKVWGLACGGILVKGWSVKIWKVEPPSR